MQFVIFILSIIIGIRTISYGIFEIQNNKNRFGGIFVITLAATSAILTNIVVYIKGI